MLVVEYFQLPGEILVLFCKYEEERRQREEKLATIYPELQLVNALTRMNYSIKFQVHIHKKFNALED
jgi:hypothetical protein